MRLFTNLLSLFAIAICMVSVRAQQELVVKDVRLKEFPEYSGKLIVRNPDGIDVNKLKFTEGDSLLNAQIDTGKQSKNRFSRKEVLFLVLNHQGYDNRTRWYQSVIYTAVKNGLIKNGDKYAIQSFDCNRPEYNSETKQLLFPSDPEFTDQSEILLNQVDQIDLNKKPFISNCKQNSDIYGAIYEALATLNKLPKDDGVLRSIVVFADDFSLVREIKEQGIIQRSREYDIPVYGLTYYQNINRKFGVQVICSDSYGEYYLDRSNDIGTASEKLQSFCDSMMVRASGTTYIFSFHSLYQKDGSQHGVQISYNNSLSGFVYDSPSMTLLEWVKANLLLSIALSFLFILTIILIVVIVKKKRKQQEEREALRQAELQKLEEEQNAVSLKAAQQEEEIRRMKEMERQKEEEARSAKAAAEKENENELKLAQMGLKGNLPWFTFTYQGQSGSFEVNHPEFYVGRGDENNYRINLPIVSRQHFVITFNNGVYTLTDLQSSNGTLVNGYKVTSTPIKHGDVVSIGEIDLTFHI